MHEAYMALHSCKSCKGGREACFSSSPAMFMLNLFLLRFHVWALSEEKEAEHDACCWWGFMRFNYEDEKNSHKKKLSSLC